jgi:phage tail sheath protein FI
MPEYLAPGVYVEETDTGTKSIEGVSTSTAGFVGLTKRGPTSGLPVLVASFNEFQRRFGGHFDFGPTFLGHSYLPLAVDGFFSNGGKRLYIMRVKGAGASTAKTTTHGGLIMRLRKGEDAPIAQTKFKPDTLRGLDDGTKVRLRMVKEGVTYESGDLTIDTNGVDRSTGEVTVSANITITPAGPPAFEAKYTTVFTDLKGLDAGGLPTSLGTPLDPRPSSFTIDAKDEGSWGSDIVIQAAHEPGVRAEMDAFVSGAVDNNKIRLKSAAGFYVDAWVEIDRGKQKRYRRVKSVDGTVLTLYGPALAAAGVAPQAPATATIFSTCEFKLVVSYEATVEQFSGLTLEKVNGRYYEDIVNGGSNLIKVGAPAAGNTHPLFFPSGADGIRVLFDTAGSDGTAPPADTDYKGTDGGPGNRTGIRALEDIDQISIIAAPGLAAQIVQNALIEQCERLKDRFAILDPKPKASDLAPDLNDIQLQRNLYDTKYAALYYPRLRVYDLLSDKDISIPPSGHMAGIYARTDIERGVHKAPANEVIRNITGYELTINKEAQDILNPSPVNINVLRDFRADGRGFRVWGARCITSDSDWKYVPVRRLFIFLEESLDQGTQWVVFEPNDEPTWARVRQSVTNFLTRVWRDGALMGATPEQAFFVKCDRTTMTQDDIDNGRLIMIIGVAPVKPAEYVIIRIGQWAGGSLAEEI